MRRYYNKLLIEAGCDEAGRGCLAGPVFAAAVILPKNFRHKKLNDSKKMTASDRMDLRKIIEEKAIAFAVEQVNNKEIDRINILKASFLAMHRAVDKLTLKPELLLIDGNRFSPYKNIRHHCIIKGDGKYAAIAAASVLAKTYRDEFMAKMHLKFPLYNWGSNKGYPTLEHRTAIHQYGITPMHRKTFRVLPPTQLELFNNCSENKAEH